MSLCNYVFFFRYGNILCYDNNRVELVNPIDGCKYINASWITSDGSKPSKILTTQGPLPHTLPHFLQMMVEQRVDCIVMLTKLAERKQDGLSIIF